MRTVKREVNEGWINPHPLCWMRSAAELTEGWIFRIKIMAEEVLHLGTGEATCLRSSRTVHRSRGWLLQLVYAVRTAFLRWSVIGGNLLSYQTTASIICW